MKGRTQAIVGIADRDQIGVNDMEELKKCPFCDGEASLKVNHGFGEEVISAFVTARNAELQHEIVLQKLRLGECGIGEWKNDRGDG